MLSSSGSARPRYGNSRASLSSLTVSATPIRAGTPTQPQRLPSVPLQLDTSLDSKKLICPSSEPSCDSARVHGLASPASYYPPLAPSSSPPSSASTVSVASLSNADETCAPKHLTTPTPALPTDLLPEAELRVRFLKWLNTGRLIPLDLPCTRDAYISTARLLETEGFLPRLARDFDPTTNTWHIRSRPHTLHEIGHPVIGDLKSLLQPQLANTVFGTLSNKILWHRGSDTTALPNGGVKEPDAGIGLKKRALPTIVIEVGYSESRAKLRLDAQRWLQTGLPDRSRVKRKRGEPDEDTTDINPRPVMLVILISFEGQCPTTLDDKFTYSETDFPDIDSPLDVATPDAPKPLTVWVELWRLSPVDSERPSTHSNTVRAPALADRKQFWPAPDPGAPDFVELFATDIFGSDKVRDPGNTTRFRIPLVLFQEVLRDLIMEVQEESGGEVSSDSDDEVVVMGGEGAEEDGYEDENGRDGEEEEEDGNAFLNLRSKADGRSGVTPAKKRQRV